MKTWWASDTKIKNLIDESFLRQTTRSMTLNFLLDIDYAEAVLYVQKAKLGMTFANISWLGNMLFIGNM